MKQNNNSQIVGMRSTNELLLSIIIPAYNIESYLETCVRCVPIDDHPDWEIIIVNDCSTDNTLAMCHKIERESKGVRVISFPKNRGVSAARNAAIAAAKGKYLAFVDGDDLIEPDTFEANLRILEADSTIDAVHFPIRIEKNGEVLNTKKLPQGVSFAKNEILELVFRYRGGFYFWGYLFKRALFDKLQFEEGRAISEDTVLFPLIVSQINKIFFSDKGTYLYELRDDSSTFSNMSYRKISQFAESTYIGLNRTRDICGTKHYTVSVQYILLIHLFAKMVVKGRKEGIDSKTINQNIKSLSDTNLTLYQMSFKGLSISQKSQMMIIGLLGAQTIVQIEVFIRTYDFLFEIFRNRHLPRID